MLENPIAALASVIVLGVGAQWLSWRLRFPSILLLLVIGVTAGPITGLLHPGDLFGASLLPIVSLSVGLILYEGGLSLRLDELSKVGRVVRNLLTVGVGVGWVLSSLLAWLILGMEPPLAILLGAILVVTGPTVVGPLLQLIRPVGPVAPILRWEGIAIDPIGALLAVLVFEVISSGEGHNLLTHSGMALAKTIVVGGGLGLCAAGLLTLLLKRYWVPDELQNPVSLMLVVAAFGASHMIQEESGLLATTVMGIALANQKFVTVEHIIEFKEDLRVLLIGMLFILLGAHLKLEAIMRVGPPTVAFVVLLIVVVRPLAVWASTLRSDLQRHERLFLAWMAPRGIVAAAVSSVFALRLEQAGYEQAGVLVSSTFAVILGTVSVYGLSAPWLARKLKVADPNPQGLVIAGADVWARAVAEALKGRGLRVILIDTNYNRIAAARTVGIETYRGSILSEHLLDRLDLGGTGRFLAATPNDEVNTLATQRFAPVFGTANVYRLTPNKNSPRNADQQDTAHSRLLFDPEATYRNLHDRVAAGHIVKATPLTEKFDYTAFRNLYGPTAIPLFTVDDSGKLSVITTDNTAEPKPGQTIVSLVEERESEKE